MEEKVEII